MQRTTIAALLSILVVTASAAAEELNVPRGFTALFNGKDLSGWHGMGHFDPYRLDAMNDEERAAKRKKDMEPTLAHWSVENGEIVNDGQGPYLTTDREFGDIEFLIEYKTVAKADSGIYLRATPQVQIWDTTKAGGKWNIGADKGSGGLWNNSNGARGKDPLVLADKPFGEWNAFRIRQIGARTSVWLNGKLVVDNAIMENYWKKGGFNRAPLKSDPKGSKYRLPLRARGPIQLQTHGGEIRWRNLFIREIPPEEANKILQSSRDEGYKSIFDGKSLDGWSGALKNYEVVDGAIACKPNSGGNLYTSEKYLDFAVRFDFVVPRGGNNGLAIRYPGNGDPAYVGMCELQVLDNTAKGYSNLDPRQYHGSAYGMVPAHRGYLRPAGQWNFQEVHVKGTKIRVELNGTVILDTDLGSVKEFMSPHMKNAYESYLREAGHFGFAGHGSAVKFRNIRLKRL